MPTSSKVIILCADDYGYNDSVSFGIRELIVQNRLSAVSCMVNKADFSIHAQALLALQRPISTGLHFNLTEGNFLSQPQKVCWSLNTLLVKIYLKQLNINEIIQELHSQIDKFIELFGFSPDFVDGHQHVHQFPIIREALLVVYKQRLQGKYLRCTYPYLSRSKYTYKCAILAVLGGYAFNKSLEKSSIPHNAYFAGIYDFKEKNNYRNLFQYWLRTAKNNTLIMCHPGHSDSFYKDPIAHSRQQEYAYFMSNDFIEDCKKLGVICKPIILKR